MSPHDFLEVAGEWAVANREAEWRSAASRAYYAAFHVARQLLLQWGFVVPSADQAHAYLWLRLANAGHPDVNRAGNDLRYLPATSDWHGRFRLVPRKDNDYEIDRGTQARNESYSGIQSIGRQDQACVESMEEIVDRSLEHLAPSDRMIAVTRKRLLQAAQELMNEKKVPATVDNPDIYRGARGGAFVAPIEQDWLDAYAEKLQTAKSPLGLLDRNRLPLAAE